MVVSNDGKNRIRDLLSADIVDSSLGTDSTTATAGDTDLGAEVAATVATPTQTIGNKIINTKHVLVSTLGNGNTLNEFGVFCDSGNTLLSRSVFPDFVKTESLELHTTVVYRIK